MSSFYLKAQEKARIRKEEERKKKEDEADDSDQPKDANDWYKAPVAENGNTFWLSGCDFRVQGDSYELDAKLQLKANGQNGTAHSKDNGIHLINKLTPALSPAEIEKLQIELRSQSRDNVHGRGTSDDVACLDRQSAALQCFHQAVSADWAPRRHLHARILPSPEAPTREAAEDASSSSLKFMTKEDIQRMRVEMRKECSRRAQEQARKRMPTSGDCPLFLSVRMRRILEFVLLRESSAEGASTKDANLNAVQLDDSASQVAAALVYHNNFTPACVLQFLQDVDVTAKGMSNAEDLYQHLLETMGRELRDSMPTFVDMAGSLGGRLPVLLPTALGQSMLMLMGRPADVVDAEGAASAKSAYSGPLRIWFGPEDDSAASTQPIVINRKISMTDLPIAAKRKLIMDTVQQNRLTLLQGETGSGKTTQVPQFILEALAHSPKGVRIVVTQPRRIAAITVAKRVAEELGEVVGEGIVGYKIRGVSMVSPKCRLLFCTTGVLLRRLGQEGGQDDMFSAKTVTHLLVDEVHERSCETDFMLTFLRDVVHKRPNLRIVLMSATMDAECFLRYFKTVDVAASDGEAKEPPLVLVSGRCYPTHEIFLDAINAMLGRDGTAEAMGYEELRREPAQNFSENDGIDYELILAILREIDNHEDGAWRFVSEKGIQRPDSLKDGAVLVFMPGAGEITQMIATIDEDGVPNHWWVLPLHGALPAEEQQDAFRTNLPEGKTWKIIICTNVAETSVTVPDVTIVIDSCRERRTGIDKFSNTPHLKEQFCALDSLKQRRGRAGRVRPGVCLRLISQRKFESLDTKTPPEMQRVPLENVYLQLCSCGVVDQGAFLSKCPDPPEPIAVQFARAALTDLGALDTAAADGLTSLGRHLAALPCHPRLGKMLVLGCILSVPGPVMNICAAMSGRSPLRTTQDTQKRSAWQAERQKLLKRLGHKSDHCVWAVLMQLWISEGVARSDLCNTYGLSYERMSSAWFERRHLVESLSQAGFLPDDFVQNEREEESPVPDWTVVRAAISGALYPNIVRVEKTAPKNPSSADIGEKNKWMRYSFLQRQVNVGEATGYPKSCNMHPNSLCFGQDNFDCPLLAFYTIQQTTKLYVYDVTEVNPWALLLFGTQPDWNESNRTIEVGGWARFHCTHKEPVFTLINSARKAVQGVLSRKVKDVAFDAASSPEIAACIDLIRTWGLGYLPVGEEVTWPFLEEFREEAAKNVELTG